MWRKRLPERRASGQQEKQGDRFSERAFLDAVLSFGPVPLPAVAKGLGL